MGTQACSLRGYGPVVYAAVYGVKLEAFKNGRRFAVGEVHDRGRVGNDAVVSLRSNGAYWCGAIDVHTIVAGVPGSDPPRALRYYFVTPGQLTFVSVGRSSSSSDGVLMARARSDR